MKAMDLVGEPVHPWGVLSHPYPALQETPHVVGTICAAEE